jgi:hypothetical protein
MDILTLKDRIDANEFRSDRHPAVPFVTFADMLKTSTQPVAPNHPQCGASLAIGVGRDLIVRYCEKRLGHVWNEGTEHDWADML